MTEVLDDPLLTSQQLADLLHVRPETLIQRRHHGRPMPISIKVGRQVLYRRSAVEAFLREQEQRPTADAARY
jgi:hypothetical protein